MQPACEVHLEEAGVEWRSEDYSCSYLLTAKGASQRGSSLIFHRFLPERVPSQKGQLLRVLALVFSMVFVSISGIPRHLTQENYDFSLRNNFCWAVVFANFCGYTYAYIGIERETQGERYADRACHQGAMACGERPLFPAAAIFRCARSFRSPPTSSAARFRRSRHGVRAIEPAGAVPLRPSSSFLPCAESPPPPSLRPLRAPDPEAPHEMEKRRRT